MQAAQWEVVLISLSAEEGLKDTTVIFRSMISLSSITKLNYFLISSSAIKLSEDHGRQFRSKRV